MWFGIVIAAIGGVAQMIQVQKAEKYCTRLERYNEDLQVVYAHEATDTTVTEESTEHEERTEEELGRRVEL